MSLCMSYIQDAKVGTHYLTGRLVSPILQQIALCLLVKTEFCHCNKLLKFKQIWFCLIQRKKKIQSQRQRFFKNIFQYTQSDMLLRFVAVQKEQLVARMCCSNMSSTVFQPILDLTQNQSKTSKKTWNGLDRINGRNSVPQYLSFTQFVQLQTNKFQGLFKDFSRTNYGLQGLRFM